MDAGAGIVAVVGVTVGVGSGVAVAVGLGDGVAVAVGDGVAVAVGLTVGVAVGVGVAVASGAVVAVAVGVEVATAVGLAAGLTVASVEVVGVAGASQPTSPRIPIKLANILKLLCFSILIVYHTCTEHTSESNRTHSGEPSGVLWRPLRNPYESCCSI